MRNLHICCRYIFIFLIFTSSLFAQNINVAVAANVSYAITEIVKEFNKLHSNTKVKVILGSSGKLTAQIKYGAPYDIFLSADMKYPESLFETGEAITNPLIYARGSLAYLSATPKDYSQGVKVLLNDNISKIAIGNPKTAPYGKAGFEALKNAKVFEKVRKKIVYGESISQTLVYTLQATDIGLVAKSSLYGPALKSFKENVHWIEVESHLYKQIEQGIVILKHAKDKSSARDFYNFILSTKGQEILLQFGYKI